MRATAIAISMLILVASSLWRAAGAEGEDEGPPKVPGFGPRPMALEDRFEESVLRYVDGRLLGRYDSNRNGRLDPDEMRRVPWSDTPKQDDADGDGVLSRAELAARTARRWGRGAKEVSPAKNVVPGFGPPKPPTGKDKEIPLEERYERYVLDYVAQRILGPYDRDRNGRLDPSEIRRVPWADDHRQDDANSDGYLTREELCARMVRRWGRGEKQGGQKSADQGSGGSDDEPAASWKTNGWELWKDRRSFRLRTARELLPEGLPDWFAEKDADADGQVSMAEFAEDWTEDEVARFGVLDRNGDGLITPHEALQAEKDE